MFKKFFFFVYLEIFFAIQFSRLHYKHLPQKAQKNVTKVRKEKKCVPLLLLQEKDISSKITFIEP